MDARTLEALEKSITHWAENIAAETPKQANVLSDACALCQLFLVDDGTGLDDDESGDCEGCPVYRRTGSKGCNFEIWQSAHRSYLLWIEIPNGMRDSFRVAARNMHDFLVSLRPQQET